MLTPLKTLKGSKIWYSKFGVGKQVGSKVYVHINSRFWVVPAETFERACDVLKMYKLTPDMFQTLCYDLKEPNILRFDTCEGFCTEREPTVGTMVFVDIDEQSIKTKYNKQIYHHKWLWVPEKFEGFNVQESYEWSKLWLSKFHESASGYRHKWKEQLNEVGLR